MVIVPLTETKITLNRATVGDMLMLSNNFLQLLGCHYHIPHSPVFLGIHGAAATVSSPTIAAQGGGWEWVPGTLGDDSNMSAPPKHAPPTPY